MSRKPKDISHLTTEEQGKIKADREAWRRRYHALKHNAELMNMRRVRNRIACNKYHQKKKNDKRTQSRS